MLRHQNDYIAVIFLYRREDFLLKLDCSLLMFGIKVLTNGVQFLRNNHMNNTAIIH